MAEGEYVHGSMNIEAQRATFGVFWTITKWGCILIGLALLLLAVTRTNAVDCKKSDLAAQHINSCGKLPDAEKPAEVAPAAPTEATPAPAAGNGH